MKIAVSQRTGSPDVDGGMSGGYRPPTRRVVMKSTLIALAVAGVLASSGAYAGTTRVDIDRSTGVTEFVPVQYYSDDRSMSINEREAHLRARIDRGVRDGRITNREAHQLYRELGSIEA